MSDGLFIALVLGWSRSMPRLIPAFHPVTRVISGGQTGVDRAALDAAIDLGLRHGGWCPRGRLAEDGTIPAHYDLVEHPSPLYADRTRQNVLEADGTLVLYRQSLRGGTLMTYRFALQQSRPVLRVRLVGALPFQATLAWLRDHSIETLNVAGPRASSDPEVYDRARRFIAQLLG